jgi:hypothetical protein
MRQGEKPPHQSSVQDRLRRVHERATERPQGYRSAPPANPERDDDDVKRGREKLARVLGN